MLDATSLVIGYGAIALRNLWVAFPMSNLTSFFLEYVAEQDSSAFAAALAKVPTIEVLSFEECDDEVLEILLDTDLCPLLRDLTLIHFEIDEHVLLDIVHCRTQLPDDKVCLRTLTLSAHIPINHTAASRLRMHLDTVILNGRRVDEATCDCLEDISEEEDEDEVDELVEVDEEAAE